METYSAETELGWGQDLWCGMGMNSCPRVTPQSYYPPIYQLYLPAPCVRGQTHRVASRPKRIRCMHAAGDQIDRFKLPRCKSRLQTPPDSICCRIVAQQIVQQTHRKLHNASPGNQFEKPQQVADWGGGMSAGCRPRVQLFADAGNGRPHSALRYHQLMPVSCHFPRL